MGNYLLNEGGGRIGGNFQLLTFYLSRLFYLHDAPEKVGHPLH